MRFNSLLLILSALTLAGCNSALANTSLKATESPVSYPDLGEAPELNNETWLNAPEPLRLAGLRGKVVLIDMWTYG
jgi:hypothetical protein